jgi:hypothetical protein
MSLHRAHTLANVLAIVFGVAMVIAGTAFFA